MTYSQHMIDYRNRGTVYADKKRFPDKVWEISDIDGSNKRRVTLAQYRAEVDAAKAKAEAIFAAAKRTVKP